MEYTLVAELLNPVRIKIIQLVLQKGETTSKELAELLPDIAIASLYRHIKKLIALEVLEIVSEIQVRGTIERTFKVKYDPFESIGKAMEQGDVSLHFQIFYSFLMSQLSDFTSYTGTSYDMKEDMVGFRTYPIYLSDEENQNFYEELGLILKKYLTLESEPQRKLRKFSFTMMPSKE